MVDDPEVFYADNYEEITGRQRDGSLRDSDDDGKHTKVITAKDITPVSGEPLVEHSPVVVETESVTTPAAVETE